VAPLRQGDQACLDRFEVLFSQPDLLVVELSSSVAELGWTYYAIGRGASVQALV
jgi:hypothetical protein